MASTKEVILKHLRSKRGREVPVDEIRKEHGFKLSRISNAIKDLSLTNEIEIEHRPLKRGRYTVLRLKGDNIIHRYRHPREVDTGKEIESEKFKLMNSQSSFDIPVVESEIEEKQINIFLQYLKSSNFNPGTFSDMIDALKLTNSFDLISKVIMPIQYRSGHLWEEGKLSIAEEHLISANLEKLLIQQIPQNNVNAMKVIVLLPVEHEWHTLSLLTLELLLNERGFKVYNLARPLPNISFIDFITSLDPKPTWIFISITLKAYLGTLRNELKNLREKFGDSIKIAIGGQGIEQSMINTFPEANNIITTIQELRKFLNSL